MICEGGLFLCKNCGLAEGSLTTECPGRQVKEKTAQMVYEGKVDFQDGKWLEGFSIYSPWRYKKGEGL